MKAINFVVLSTGLLFSMLVFGAADTGKSKVKVAGTASQEEANTTNLNNANSVPSQPNSVASPMGTAVSTMTMKQAVKEARPSRLSYLLDSYNYISASDANLGKGDMSALNTVRVTYKLSEETNIGLSGVFSNSWGATSSGKSEFKMRDPYLQYADSNLTELGGGLKTQAKVRLYPGVSEGSLMKKQLALLRTDLSVKKTLGPCTVGYNFSPRYNVQQQPSYINEKGVRAVNTLGTLEHYVSADLTITKKLSAYQYAGLDHVWFHTDNKLSKNKQEFVYAETALNYEVNNNFSLVGGISSWMERDLLAQNDQFSIYRDNESSYFVEATVTF